MIGVLDLCALLFLIIGVFVMGVVASTWLYVWFCQPTKGPLSTLAGADWRLLYWYMPTHRHMWIDGPEQTRDALALCDLKRHATVGEAAVDDLHRWLKVEQPHLRHLVYNQETFAHVWSVYETAVRRKKY